MKKHKKVFSITLIIMLGVMGLFIANNSTPQQNLQNTAIVKATVIEIDDHAESSNQSANHATDIQNIKVKIAKGQFKGEILNIEHLLSGNVTKDFYYNEGDRVLLWIEFSNNVITKSYIRQVVRDHYLLYLTIFFIFSLIIVGGKQGAKTILTLILTGFLILEVMIPLILEGLNPVVVSITIAFIIISASLLIISGHNRKTYSAILGTLGGVFIAGLLAMLMTHLTRLTGLSGDEAKMLVHIPQNISFDYPQLLFAGMIIGAMGAILDVGMSISSAMDEIQLNNPAITTKNLIKSGLKIGRDIMGTMSNTLILAYTGASLPLLLVLIAYDIPLVRIINVDSISTEIVRILAGSIGLIYAIPLTSIVAGFLYTRKAKGNLPR